MSRPPGAIDFALERQRHAEFVGRTALLSRLDWLLLGERTGRWVVVTGGPGMGKSALLAEWLARREAGGDVVPHHFIRRGEYDWDDPAKLVGSLVAQVAARFPDLPEPDADTREHPAARLVATLARVSQRSLAPRGEGLVLLIDGLDEYDPARGSSGPDPLAAFLPHSLPPGVSLLCASRPRHPYVDMLATRGAVLIDLDHDDAAADNVATVRAFWSRAAVDLGLNAQFVGEAVARAGGNLQHAAMLRKHVECLPPAQRRVEDIPRGLAAFLTSAWERVAIDPIVVSGLGILCAAREALTLDELGAAAGWTGEAPRRAFMRGARELLVEGRRAEGVSEYRLHHDSIRGEIARAVGAGVLRDHHRALARTLAVWPLPKDEVVRRYALRHALVHRAEAGEWADAWRLAGDMAFLEAKCRELGAQDVETDVTRTAMRCRATGDDAWSCRFEDLARALGRESHWLRVSPEAMAGLVWNRLRQAGWSLDHLEQRLRLGATTRFFRVRQVATRESHALERNLVGHALGVTACAVTPDGRRVVSASGDQTLKVWDLGTGALVATLRGHTKMVTACVVTPDGRRVISASADQTLKVWDVETGTLMSTLDGHAWGVSACAVTPDGQHVVSASGDQTLKVWNLETGVMVATLVGHASYVTACVVTPDGRHVVSTSLDQTLKIWDLPTASLVATLVGHAKMVSACAVSPDGRNVVSASLDHTLKVWDLETGALVATLTGHTSWVSACAVTPDGRRVISGSGDQTLKVWDIATGTLLVTLAGHANQVTACVVTPDGRRAVSTSQDQTLKVWDLDTGALMATLAGHASHVATCVVTHDGERVVSASVDETLKVWNLEAGRATATPGGHAGCVTACTVTPDGRRVVTASEDQMLKVWDVENATLLSTLEGHASSVSACAVTRDGRRVISAADRRLKVWDLGTGALVATLKGHANHITACVVTQDGRRVVSASNDRRIKVWDLGTGALIVTLAAHVDRVAACAVTPDGRCVVSASADRTLKVWDLTTGRLLATLAGHVRRVTACAVTPDGRRVVSASEDRTLRVWELPSGRLDATLEGHTDRVTGCAMTPDGRHVVSASADQTLRVWDLTTGEPVATLKGHVDDVTACMMTPDGQHVLSASLDETLKMWDLTSGTCLFTHHASAAYTALAATPRAIVAGDAAGAVWFLDWPSKQRRDRLEDRGPARRKRSDHGQPRSRRAQMKHIILFFAANPLDTDRLALDHEARAIQVELERSGFRDSFELVTRWAVEPLDLLHELRRLKPTVVHFSGHGREAVAGSIPDAPRDGIARDARVGAGRDFAVEGDSACGSQHGLVFQGPDRLPRVVSTQALAKVFEAAGSSVKLVVLNACYSESHASALLAHVDCVVGMHGAFHDEAARSFAIGFYGGLGDRESVAAAYKQGCAAIALEGLRDADRPQLKVREAVDAARLILASS